MAGREKMKKVKQHISLEVCIIVQNRHGRRKPFQGGWWAAGNAPSHGKSDVGCLADVLLPLLPVQASDMSRCPHVVSLSATAETSSLDNTCLSRRLWGFGQLQIFIPRPSDAPHCNIGESTISTCSPRRKGRLRSIWAWWITESP
jgi:hypothetical protein